MWDWPARTRAKHAEKITVAVTSSSSAKTTSISIADEGEGQKPSDFSTTLCSLSNSNKDRIPFTQGRYNMGGSGALRFCGKYHLQLIMSRRNPAFGQVDVSDEDNGWGFTVIRREPPEPGHRNSVYTYLAPRNHEHRPRRGDVLCFKKESMPIFPDDSGASKRFAPLPTNRPARHGTFVKLYDYLPKIPVRKAIGVHDFTLMRHLEVCLP